MWRSQLAKALVGLMVSVFTFKAAGQSTDLPLATVGDNSDEPSGWMQIEIAIFVDTSDATLATELWEVTPTLRYPANRRWLTNYDEIKSLMDEWGEAAVTVDTNGAISIVPEPPSLPDPISLTDPDEVIPSNTDDAGESSGITSDDAVTLPTTAVGTEGAVATETSEASLKEYADGGQIPLDSLQLAESEADNDVLSRPLDVAAADSDVGELHASLDDTSFHESLIDENAPENTLTEQSVEPPENPESINSTDGLLTQEPAEIQEDTGNFFAIEGLGEDFNGLVSNNENPTGLADGSLGTETIDWLSDFEAEKPTEDALLDAEPTPPPLPASYQIMPFEMLAAGLKRLEKDTGRRAVSVLSWLQPTVGASDSVVVDNWQAESTQPNLQGTVRVSGATHKTEGFELTTNLWTNTTANYLPDRLPGLEVPSAPTRVLLIEPEKATNVETEGISTEFIDISTGLNTVSASGLESEETRDSDSVATSTPVFKHAIALSETRDLREGYVRYIDHPVIQVAAVWRELTFGELYALGEAQRVRKDIDSLTRSLVVQQSKEPAFNEEQQRPSLNQ